MRFVRARYRDSGEQRSSAAMEDVSIDLVRDLSRSHFGPLAARTHDPKLAPPGAHPRYDGSACALDGVRAFARPQPVACAMDQTTGQHRTGSARRLLSCSGHLVGLTRWVSKFATLP